MIASDVIAIIAISIPTLGTFVYYYTKLNVKIAEISKEQLSMRKEFEDHKSNNKEDFQSFKEEAVMYRKENREDHQEIMKAVTEMGKHMSEIKTLFINHTHHEEH